MTSIPSPEQVADKLASDIERFAAFVRANPDIAEQIGSPTLRYCATYEQDPKAAMADVVRRGLKAGATVAKDVSDSFARANVRFGRITLEVFAQREQVCERVVTGTREVEVEEKDPEALAAVPTITKTVVVEDVEWVCSPILSATEEKAQVPA